MLQFKIIPTILLRGYQYPFQYLVKTIGMGTGKATKFMQHKNQSISLADLSALCRHLNCTPNDLFYWQENEAQTLAAEHPIHSALQPPIAADTWHKAIQKLSPTDAAELLHIINEKTKKEE